MIMLYEECAIMYGKYAFVRYRKDKSVYKNVNRINECGNSSYSKE